MMNYQRTYINLVVAFVCILGGAWLPATQAREDSLPEYRQAQTIPQGYAPTGLDREEWGQIVQQIQQSERPSAPNALTLPEVAKITASDGLPEDGFGYSVSVSGDTLVVGAQLADIDGKSAQGAAYVFYRNQGGASQWGQVKKLTAGDGAEDDRFGWSVAVSGDTLVVGAFRADTEYYNNQGAAYVFKRNQGGPDNWGQVKKLVGSESSYEDLFGRYVAINGDTIVVGAPQAIQEGTENKGEAYIFYRNQGGADNWGEVKRLTATDVDLVLGFGISVSISGDKIVVGSNTFVGGNSNQGAAYVFYQGGTDNWGQVARLTASDGVAGDDFGYRVSISGDTVVAGARVATVDDKANQGAAYVFYRNQGGADHWGEVKKLIASDGAAADSFGADVLVYDDTIVVGAVGAFGDRGPGKAYLFTRNQGGPDAWGEVTKLTASDGTASDTYGWSISISQNTLVIGANEADIGENTNQGAAYIYYYPRFSPSLYLPLIMR
jgi:FG-GAP repeat